MCHKIVSLFALSALIFSVAAQNYMFPSSNPPANLKPSEIQQYVCLMWDDVAYSGRKGTPYETAPNQKWADISRVGGYQFKTWHTTKNTLNLQQGDIGASWAISKVLPTGNNPDGSKRTMNFYVITGQMAPVTWKVGWVENPQAGDVWGWKSETFSTVNWADPTKTVLAPVCWGREYEVLTSGGAEKEEEPHTVNMYKEILTAGHGMGCHTIDHMETNSGMPKKYFTANSGEWFDPGAGAEVDLNGKQWKEQCAAWDVIGWDYLAGCKVSKECWKAALQLAEAELTQYLSVSVANGKLLGFRAPRLEMNANGLFALKELGYTYDCSIEEGFEDNMNGANAPWPYSLDNGSPSHWTRRDAGDKISFEQYPAGLWEVPVGIFIVPEDIRDEVWAHGNEINENAPDKEDWEPLASWKTHGRITAFDFNMFVLWGMTKEHFVKTLKYNLDLRMQNNKAPFCMGIHCDYFTPMYDNATLLSDSKGIPRQPRKITHRGAQKKWAVYANPYKGNVKIVGNTTDILIGHGINKDNAIKLISFSKGTLSLYLKKGAFDATLYNPNGNAVARTLGRANGSIINAPMRTNHLGNGCYILNIKYSDGLLIQRVVLAK